MMILFKNVIYLYLILIINIYVCSYFLNKISSRAELKKRFFSYKGRRPWIPGFEIIQVSC